MSQPLLDQFCEIYQQLGKDNLFKLKQVYADDVTFIDALHRVDGLPALEQYFEHLYENMLFCDFVIEQLIVQGQQASVIWTMSFAHKKIKQGEKIVVQGASHLKFKDKIEYHRDYLDMGQMLYEHIPLIGGVVKLIKKRASQ